MLIDIMDGITKKPKLGNVVEGPYRVLRQGRRIVDTQREEVIDNGYSEHEIGSKI